MSENLQEVSPLYENEEDSRFDGSSSQSYVRRDSKSRSIKHPLESMELAEKGHGISAKKMKKQEELKSAVQTKEKVEDEVIQSLQREEERWAQELRKVCTPYGDERESKLNESSEILFSLGRLYLKKAEVTTGMQQKLNFIKAAALLHGALFRFERFLKNDQKAKEVRDVLEQMEKILMKACGSKLCKTEILLRVSQALKRVFKILREVEKSDLEEVEIIPEDISEDDAHEEQLEKIEMIQDMLELNTGNFENLMGYVSEKCLNILGKPPCQFAIVGLGSLARREITLYSDFEHVIVLDEGVQDSPEYESIKAYFRWFAVVFQIIIIGLGETIIRSVGVKSINDLYAGDKKKNWFYDMITPSGISIDGMMPHACKTPLGRQELTKKKGCVVELIRPVSQMASLLTTDEDLKNGYNLKDVLLQSCFVFGCEPLFWYFKNQAKNTLHFEDDKDGLDSLSKLTKNNVNDLVQGKVVTITTGRYDVDSKSSYYRPLSALLSYIGRLKRCYDLSSFEIISKFVDKNLKHELSWAFAVACELRLKIYAFGSGNRLRVINRDFSQFVGPSCIANCIKHVTDLTLSMNDQGRGFKKEGVAEDCGTSGEIHSLLVMERYHEAGELLRKKITMLQNGSFRIGDEDRVKLLLLKTEHNLALCCYFENLKSQKSEKMKSFNEAKELLKSCDGVSCEYECAGYLYDIHCWLGHFRDAVHVVQKCLEHGAGDVVFKDLPINCFDFGKLILTSYTDPSLALSYCNDALLKYKGLLSQLAFRYGRALAMIKCGMEDGRKELHDLTADVVKIEIKNLEKDHVLLFIDDVFMEEMRNKWWEDALDTMETGKVLLESNFQEDDAANFASHLLSVSDAAICYLKNLSLDSSFEERYELFVNVVKNCGRSDELLHREGRFCYYMNVRALDLLLHMDCETNILLKYTHELTTDGLDDFNVRTNIVSQLLVLLGFYRKKISQYHGMIYDVAEGLIKVVGKYRTVLYHPLFGNVLSILCADVHAAVEVFRRRIEDTFGEPVYSDRDHTMDIFNCYDIFEPDDFQNLDEHIHMFEVMKSLKYKLDDFFPKVIMELYLFGSSFIEKRYDASVKMWFQADFEGCIHVFWRIINYKREDIRVWTRSVIMFYHSVVVMLGMKFLYRKKGQTLVTFIERQQIVEWPFLVKYSEDES